VRAYQARGPQCQLARYTALSLRPYFIYSLSTPPTPLLDFLSLIITTIIMHVCMHSASGKREASRFRLSLSAVC
jgi:hypothetical protein